MAKVKNTGKGGLRKRPVKKWTLFQRNVGATQEIPAEGFTEISNKMITVAPLTDQEFKPGPKPGMKAPTQKRKRSDKNNEAADTMCIIDWINQKSGVSVRREIKKTGSANIENK